MLRLPSEVIREMRSVLFERGWTQHQMVHLDGSVCLMGAEQAALDCLFEKGDVCLASANPVIYEAIFGRGCRSGVSIPKWNDAEGRTFDEVIEILDKAEKIAEQREVGTVERLAPIFDLFEREGFTAIAGLGRYSFQHLLGLIDDAGPV